MQKAEKERREKDDSGENKENKVVSCLQEKTSQPLFTLLTFLATNLTLKENNFLTPGPNTNSRKSGRKVGEQVRPFSLQSPPKRPLSKCVFILLQFVEGQGGK